MNNLTQTQTDAKQAFLDKQLEQTIAHFENADRSERIAAIEHINSWLPNESEHGKMFWLKVRRKLEEMNE